MPKILGSSLEEHRENTRTRVFEAFTELMGEQSYDTITLADVAARAGVGRTALYNHFRDKEAVVVAYATAETDQYIERLREALDGAENPVEAMRMYVRQHIALQGEFHFGFGPELHGFLSRESLVAIRDHVVAVENVVRTIIDEGIASGDFTVVDVDATVTLIHACLQPRRLDAEAVADFVLAALHVG